MGIEVKVVDNRFEGASIGSRPYLGIPKGAISIEIAY